MDRREFNKQLLILAALGPVALSTGEAAALDWGKDDTSPLTMISSHKKLDQITGPFGGDYGVRLCNYDQESQTGRLEVEAKNAFLNDLGCNRCFTVFYVFEDSNGSGELDKILGAEARVCNWCWTAYAIGFSGEIEGLGFRFEEKPYSFCGAETIDQEGIDMSPRFFDTLKDPEKMKRMFTAQLTLGMPVLNEYYRAFFDKAQEGCK